MEEEAQQVNSSTKMKRVEGVTYLYCCEKWHERWNNKLMTRWMPRHMFVAENALCCLLCEEMRRQLLPRRRKRLRRMREEAEDEEEESSSRSFEVETLKRCSKKEHRKWWDESYSRWQPLRYFTKDKSRKDGLDYICRFCKREKQKLRREGNKRKLAQMAEDPDAEKECICEQHEEFAGEDVPRMQPLRNFYRDVANPDGRRNYCKPCARELQKLLQKEYARKNKKRKRDPSGTKRCPRCEQELPYSEFHKNMSNKDGVQDCCKFCKSEYDKKRKKNSPLN